MRAQGFGQAPDEEKEEAFKIIFSKIKNRANFKMGAVSVYPAPFPNIMFFVMWEHKEALDKSPGWVLR